MRKLMHFTAGVAVGALAIMIMTKAPSSSVGQPTLPPTISIEGLHRSIDLSALPVREVKEPF